MYFLDPQGLKYAYYPIGGLLTLFELLVLNESQINFCLISHQNIHMTLNRCASLCNT